MVPTDNKEDWLAFLDVPPKETPLPTQTLEYSSLLSAINGTLKTSITHQQEATVAQQQHQQQQQQFVHEDIEANKERMRRIQELLEKEKQETAATKDNSFLINIIQRNLTQSKDLTEKITSKIDDTQEPEALINKIRNTISKIKKSVSLDKISENALQKTIENIDYFVDGITLDNLPAGFFIEKDGHNTFLKFDIEAFEKAREKNLEKTHNSYSNPPILSGPDTSHEDSDITITKEEIFELLSSDPDLSTLNPEIFSTLEFTSENLKALAPILNSENGTIKLRALLKTLQEIKTENPELYENIKACFIDKSNNLLEITNLETLRTIKEIDNLSPTQKAWWYSLTEQHTSDFGVGKSSLLELYTTFNNFYQDLNSFWQTVYEQDIELPYPCPIKNIGNIQVALNRISYIVKHAAYPRDQLQHLDGLDLQRAEKSYRRSWDTMRFINPEISEWENSTSPKRFFLEKLYTIKPEESQYFPSYSTALSLWQPIEEIINKYFGELNNQHPAYGIKTETIPQIAADMLQREIQTDQIYPFLSQLIPYAQQKFSEEISAQDRDKLYNLLQSKYPVFINKEGKLSPNLKHLELALNNPTAPSVIFYTLEYDKVFTSKNGSEQQPPKSDILSCLLSIELKSDSSDLKEIVDELYTLYDENPDPLPIFARILSYTDFGNTEEGALVTKEQLFTIIETCKGITSPTYKAVRAAVEQTAPAVKFLPDLEYAKLLAEETPNDLHAIIKLFKPIFNEIGLSIDSENLPDTGEKVAARSDEQLIGSFIKPQLENLKSEDEEKIITALLKIVQAARDNLVAGIKTKPKLTEIKENQIKVTLELLKQLGFNQTSIDTLVNPTKEIALTSGDLVSKLNDLVATTSWVKEFATNYSQTAESNKWQAESEEFIKNVSDNLDKVSSNINQLLNIYTKYPKLSQNSFFTPNETLKKILPNKLTNDHIDIINKAARIQTSEKYISKKHLNLIFDAALKFQDPEITHIILELAFDQDKYEDFPVYDLLSFITNFVEIGLAKEEKTLKKQKTKFFKKQKLSGKEIEKALGEKKLELEKELTVVIKDLPFFYSETLDLASLNNFMKPLLNNMAQQTDIIPQFYLKKILQEFEAERQKPLFKIINLISIQEKKSKTKNKDSLHLNIFQIISHLEHLATSDEQLFKKVIDLYDTYPCPNSKQLLTLLENSENLEALKGNLEIDPYGERLNKNGDLNSKFSQKHFSTGTINQVILGLEDKNSHIPTEILEELRSDFYYINSIGSTHDFPNSEPPKPIWKMSRLELLDHLEKCKTTIKNPEKKETKKYLAKLQAIALLRETMYRTTKMTPNSTQILSALLQTKNKRNTCMQINTGEGKSITNPLLAAMQHLEGYAVNVFTSNTLLAVRDKRERQDFWDYLNIPTTFIAKNSPSSTYIPEGINYTTPADFSLYSSATGEEPENMAGVYDESDLAFYETNTEFNFSDSIDKENLDPYFNPYAWAYQLINNFANTDDNYQILTDRLVAADTESEKQIISHQIATTLRSHLKSQANLQQLKTIDENRIDPNRLLKWLAAAESVKNLEIGKDYIIKEMERNEYSEIKHYRTICILDGESHEIEGAILANGAHQLLSSKLQQEKPEGLPFVIDQESFCISSKNAHTELGRMNKIIGITGTMGHEELLDEFGKHHQIKGIIVPPHNTNKRKDLPPRFANGSKQHLKMIRRELAKKRNETQLTICSDIEQCEEAYENLKEFARAKKLTLILATANGYEKYNGNTQKTQTIADERTLLKYASKNRTITISTPLLGRGVNIRNLTKVIRTTFDPSERLESQVNGRTGRYGKKGITIGIYDWQQICKKQSLTETQITATNSKARRIILDTIRNQAQASEVDRLNLFSRIKSISVQHQNYFDQALKTCKPSEKQALLLQKNSLIEKFARLREKILNEIQDMDERIESFKKGTESIWKNISEENPILISAKETITRGNIESQEKDSGYYRIQTSLHNSDDIGLLISEYSTRDQIIYSDIEPNDQQTIDIPNQFGHDLVNFLQQIEGTLNTNNMEPIIEKYIAPYFKFAEKWKSKHPQIEQKTNEYLKSYTQSLRLDSNDKHLYLYHLCRAKLLSENPELAQYDINNITTKQKELVLTALQEHLENTEDKKETLGNIIQNKPTGDAVIDYHVMLLKKQRSWFRQESFGETRSFKKLIQNDLQDNKEIQELTME